MRRALLARTLALHGEAIRTPYPQSRSAAERTPSLAQALPQAPPPTAVDRVEAALADAAAPLSLKAVRAAVRMRAVTVSDALATLVTQGRACRSDSGYVLASR